MHTPAIQVLIADDHLMLAEGLSNNLRLEDQIEVVGTAANGREVLSILAKVPTDVVLMDLDMPIMDGVEATKIIRKEYANIKVIALSMHTNVNYVKKILKAGAVGYLLKDATKDEILKAVQDVFAGKKVLDPKIAQRLFLSEESEDNDFIPSLTRREKEILTLIAKELTNQEIADEIFISLSTVEFHRKNLLRKFDARNGVGLIKKAMHFGFLG